MDGGWIGCFLRAAEIVIKAQKNAQMVKLKA
jgi:hypothetical protein